jgi:hypothetical protein
VRRARLAVPLAAGGGLGLLIAAQTQLQVQRLGALVVLALAAGLFLTLVAAYVAPDERAAPEASVRQRRPVRPAPLVLAVACALVTWFTTGGGVFTLPSVIAWPLSIGAWCWAWWPASEARGSWRPRLERPVLWALLAVVALGAFFRFYRLASVPGDPTSDQAEKLLDIRDVDDGQHPIFFARNAGREPAQFYFTYVLMKVFGLSLSFGTLKLGTALIGVAAIVAVLLFASEVAGRFAGVTAAALFAVSSWPVATARIGLRFPYAPLAAALALWLLLRYLRHGDRRDALARGVVLGLGLYGYTPFRVVPLLALLLLGLALVVRRHDHAYVRRAAADGGVLFGGALIASLPLLHYAVRYWEVFSYRAATRTEIQSFGNAVETFADNTVNGLLAFNWRGDRAWIVSVPFDPLLDLVTAGALLAGLVLVCYRTARRDLVSAGLCSVGSCCSCRRP